MHRALRRHYLAALKSRMLQNQHLWSVVFRVRHLLPLLIGFDTDFQFEQSQIWKTR